MSEQNQHFVKMNMQYWDNQLGGHLDEWVELEDIKGDPECQSDREGDQIDGRQDWKNDATSSTCSDLIQIHMSPLAKNDADQHRQHRCMATDIPESSKPPSINQRPSTNQPNPLCHHGWIKTWPRRVSNPKWACQAIQMCWGWIRWIKCTGYVTYGLEMAGSNICRGAIHKDEATEAYWGWTVCTWTAWVNH